MEYIKAKKLISTYIKSNSWFGNDYNLNIYKGCNHGCIYCDSRSECYRVENFDNIRAKEDALLIIENQLRSIRRKGVVASGAMSDPYNSFEKELELTRGSLRLLNRYHFGASVLSKSDLITRDIDIFKEIKTHSPIIAKMTITTFDDNLSKIIEPNVSSSSKRFAAIEKIASNSIFTGILMMPILPFINDNKENIINIVKSASNSGAKFIYPWFGLTLRDNQRDWYYDKLDAHFPGIKEKYIRNYNYKYECNSPQINELMLIFKNQCDSYNILYNMEDIVKAYKSPYEKEQISIYDLI